MAGIWLAVKTYRDKGLEGGRAYAERYPLAHRLLVNKYWVDELYDATVVRPLRGLSNFCRRIVDGILIDGLVVHGSAFISEITGDLLRFTITGNVRSYALYFLLGLIAIFWWML